MKRRREDDFMDTYLYARDLPTLQYVLYEIMEKAAVKIDPHAASQVTNTVSPMSVRMVITVVATVLILVVYPFLQKYLVGGMTVNEWNLPVEYEFPVDVFLLVIAAVRLPENRSGGDCSVVPGALQNFFCDRMKIAVVTDGLVGTVNAD